MSTEVQSVPEAPAGPTAEPALSAVATESNAVVTESSTTTTTASTATTSKFFSREKKKGTPEQFIFLRFIFSRFLRQEFFRLFKVLEISMCSGGACPDDCLLTLNV